MICSQIITYILIVFIVFVMYPKYSLTPLNMVGNVFSIVLLYYLCKKGYKLIAWGFVIIPVILVILNRKTFDTIARSYK